jgi:nucleoside 2-deoxyribosyltransferase
MSVIYLIGSLRNDKVPATAHRLRQYGFEVFDDWFAAGPIADDSWQAYEKGRGTTYAQALTNFAARHVFSFDHTHLNRADIGVLLMPAGKSGHLELGYMIGKGKPGYVLFDEEPLRWDQMYQFANDIYFDVDQLGEALANEYL